MDIDFVVLWVDGNDPEWQAEKARYQGKTLDDSNSVSRFRDWGLMPYWFRAVEKYTPWVRKIHFVTCGHVPAWLRLDHPKLNHVRHSDYIPPENLPTFSANPIEMNIHRIPDLTEHFVFFNDDMFLLRPMEEKAFFQSGLPCASGWETALAPHGEAEIWQHISLNDTRVINNHFNKRDQVRLYRKKFTSPAYPIRNRLRSLTLEYLYHNRFVGFANPHAPAAFLKKTFETLWEEEPMLMQATSSHRFRAADDVNQWLALWWQVASGQFTPAAVDNMIIDLDDWTVRLMCDAIRGQTHDMICINDPAEDIDFTGLSQKLRDAFDVILPEKCSFEK